MIRNISICLFMMMALLPISALSKEKAQESIAFYYANDVPADELSLFERVVVEPSNVSKKELSQLKQHGSQIFAYVSIGEARRERPWFSGTASAWVIGENKSWGSVVMDLSNPHWQNFIVDKLVSELVAKSYSGIFMDTLDSYNLVAKTPEERKLQEQGLVKIIRQLHKKFPKLKLLLNRGFDVLKDVHTVVDGVVAESLFQTWNAATQSYTKVSSENQTWLQKKLSSIKKSYDLPIYVIDYVPVNKRQLARKTARKIMSLGFVPWVSNMSLNMLGVSNLEIVPRKVIVLYDSLVSKLAFAEGHRFLAAPLEYMGYMIEYIDVQKSFPKKILIGRYAGIVSWFPTGFMNAPIQTEHWLMKNIDAGMPVALLNSLGFNPDEKFLHHLGLKLVANKIVRPIKVIHRDDMTDMEATSGTLIRGLLPLIAIDPNLQVHQSIEDANHVRMDTIITAPWGGIGLAPYVIKKEFGGNVLWRLNIFKFLKKALHIKPVPMFDVTTENGSRLLMTHIDGDGVASHADMPGRPLAIRVIYDEILRKYPWPATVSVITSEIESGGLYPHRAAEMQQIARDIFSLPHVEIASHTYSHPFDWSRAAVDEKEHLHIPGYTYSLEKEILGSVSYINENLAPKGKKLKVFLWSGDALPGERALALTKSIGIRNMNGGDTLISRDHPSITNVSSMMRPVGKQLQIYAPIMNENLYTHEWTSSFYGFSRVIETFNRTNLPRRLKPIDIYYHFYSGSKYAALAALKYVYDWSLKQDVLSVWVSEYVDKVEAYSRAVMGVRLDGSWILSAPHALKTLRIDKQLGWPDLEKSYGIAGVRDLPQGRYVHLTGLKKNEGLYQLYFQNSVPSQAYLLHANAELKAWRTSNKGNIIHFRLKGHMPIQFVMSKNCALTIGKNKIYPQQATHGYRYSLKIKDTGNATLRCR